MPTRDLYKWLVLILVTVSSNRSLPAAGAPAKSAAVRIIFDTDMDSDCDDVAALAMVHALADRGEAIILATIISSSHRWSAPCTDAINTFYGRPDLPIGATKSKSASKQDSKYARRLATEFTQDLATTGEVNPDKIPDAVDVYRRVLANEGDESVTIVTVGDLTNLRYLLESPADKHSPLDGCALVKQKVRHWVCMGSRYPADLDPAAWGNFKMDPESTVKAIEGWPTLITFTGGGKFAESLATGRRAAELPAHHPVRRGYELYFGGAPKDRHSADQIAVLVAVRGTGRPWKLVTEGHNHIFANGTHQWRTTSDNPLHQYISALADGEDAKQVAAEIESLMLHQPKARR